MSAPNELSFLPDDYLAHKAQRRTNAICAGLFIVVMVGIGTAFTLTEKAMRQVEARHAQVDQQYTEAARRIEQVRQMQEQQRRMSRQAELTASLLEKVPRTIILAEITNSLPAGASLLDLVLESRRRPMNPPVAKTTLDPKKTDVSKAAPSPEVQVYDVSMRLSGVAHTDVQVAQFLRKLSTSLLFRDVNLVISEQHKVADQMMRKFQIELTLDPLAEPRPATRPVRTAAVELGGALP